MARFIVRISIFDKLHNFLSTGKDIFIFVKINFPSLSVPFFSEGITLFLLVLHAQIVLKFKKDVLWVLVLSLRLTPFQQGGDLADEIRDKLGLTEFGDKFLVLRFILVTLCLIQESPIFGVAPVPVNLGTKARLYYYNRYKGHALKAEYDPIAGHDWQTETPEGIWNSLSTEVLPNIL